MLRWLQSGHASEARATVPSVAVDEQACPGMARALKRILSKSERPEVLDLGQFSPSAALYLAKRGARVTVEDFEPPPPTVRRKKTDAVSDDETPDKQPVVITQPDGKFDLVITWEHGDFIPPDRLQDFAAEMSRVLAPGGWLLMYAKDNPGSTPAREDRPACYRLTADDRILRSPAAGPARPRWAHPNRMIERALAPMSVQSIHLQRNRIREILVRKPETTC
ncbi:MAG: class I SAM-dependent methyltransferase [Planctomycetota bacterium]|jgi:SAM-dependent methyltransferase